jgi:hypothetical protein
MTQKMFIRPFCSYDYHQPSRSVTSTSNEINIDSTHDKRDHRRYQQQRSNNSRQAAYPGQSSSSTATNATDRSYAHGRFLLIRIVSCLTLFLV